MGDFDPAELQWIEVLVILLSASSERKEAPVSDSSEKQPTKNGETGAQEDPVQEKSLQRMEALLKQSAQGIHILFQNKDIAAAMKNVKDTADFFDFNKMKRVQDVMTELIGKPTYYEKLAFIQDLDAESYQMLIRTYFHIVENTVRANTEQHH